jgi:hypothetical protein
VKFIEKPERVDRQITKEARRLERRGKRLTVLLTPAESRTFWEDLIEDGMPGDPTSDAEFEAFAAPGVFKYGETKVKLNKDGA